MPDGIRLDLSGNNTDAAVRWTFTRSAPRLHLSGPDNEFLAFIIKDDLDGLTYHRAAVQGVQRETT